MEGCGHTFQNIDLQMSEQKYNYIGYIDVYD